MDRRVQHSRQEAAQQAYVEVLDGVSAGRRVSIGEELYIGRFTDGDHSGDTTLQLPAADVSRQHARIAREGDTYRIEDLSSTNGTVVAGQRLRAGIEYPLFDRAEIRVGNTRLLFHDVEGVRGEAPASYGATGPAQPELPPEVAARHGIRSRNRGLAIELLDERPLDPDLSVAIDASQLLQQLRGRARPDTTDLDAVVKRLQAMTQVSIALGATTDLDRLVARIMECIFDIFPTAERAFVMLHDKDGGELAPAAARRREGELADGEIIAVSRTIVNEVVSNKRSILSVDTLGDERFGAQESVVALSLRSVMCAPLLIEDEVLGLIQVDNSSDARAFNSEDLQVLTGICAQTAIALKNFQLYADIENLFEGFVRASVHAIEARDPATAGHSFRVAEYTERLTRAVDRSDAPAVRGMRFSAEQLREVRYAALLHDFGKVGVREDVLTKKKKLHEHQMALLEQRFQYAAVCLERQTYKRLIDLVEAKGLSREEFARERRKLEQQVGAELARLERFLGVVSQANEPAVAQAQIPAELTDVARYTFPDRTGNHAPLLQEFEFSDLTLARGSLTPRERLDIEAHVSHSFAFLRLIPWTNALARVADIAHAHHEKLDGSGYPDGIKGDKISRLTRILSIVDTYDALTTTRPYRKKMTRDEAKQIMTESFANKLDQDLVQKFFEVI